MKKLKAKHSCRTYLAAMPKFMHATALHLNSVQFSADRLFLVDLSISRMSNNVAPIWHKIQVMLVRSQTKPSHAHAYIHPNDEITYANCFEKWRKQIKLIKYCIGFVLFPLVLCHKYSFFPYIFFILSNLFALIKIVDNKIANFTSLFASQYPYTLFGLHNFAPQKRANNVTKKKN